MKYIQVIYWVSLFEKETGLKNKETFDYSLKKRNSIITTILNAKLNVMLLQNGEYLVIAIDDKRFQQR